MTMAASIINLHPIIFPSLNGLKFLLARLHVSVARDYWTLSYSSKIHSYLYSQRASLPLKKKAVMFSEGNAAHPVGCDSTLQLGMAVWYPFFEFEILCRCDNPLLTTMLFGALQISKKCANRPNYLQRAVTPNQITQQNSLQRAGGP